MTPRQRVSAGRKRMARLCVLLICGGWALSASAAEEVQPATADCWRINSQEGWGAAFDGAQCHPSADAAGAQIARNVETAYKRQETCWALEWQYGGRYEVLLSRPSYGTVVLHGTITAIALCSGGTRHTSAAKLTSLIENYGGACPSWATPYAHHPTRCRCNAGYATARGGTACYWLVTRLHQDQPQVCTGNPIHPQTASKSRTEPLGRWLGLDLSMVYDTRIQLLAANKTEPRENTPSFGGLWRSTLHKALVPQHERLGRLRAIQAYRGGWRVITFTPGSGSDWVAPPGVADTLRRGGVAGGWEYRDTALGTLESYDVYWRLVHVQELGGRTWTYHYASDAYAAVHLVSEIRDAFGRRLGFDYESGPAGPRITGVRVDGTLQVTTGYDSSGNLNAVQRVGETARRFVYEDTRSPWALTGVVGENGSRLSTYTYDDMGRAVSTEGAAGSERYSLRYAEAPAPRIVETEDHGALTLYRDLYWRLPSGAQVVGPDGAVIDYLFTEVANQPRLGQQSQPAGAGCAAAASLIDHDSQGRVRTKVDFRGVRSCFARDAMGRETVVIDGLPPASDCDAMLSGSAPLPPEATKTSHQWHALSAPHRTHTAEPGRRTTRVYHGHADPFNGNTPARCAPATARLVDGQPITLLCRLVQQATIDGTGALGLAAPLEPGTHMREWRWVYDERGQVLAVAGPAGDTTQILYHDPSLSAGRANDVLAETNALGHTVRYPRYDAHGNWLERVDANGILTTRTYDGRQRLTTETTQGLTRRFDYHPLGHLARITEPDGSALVFDQDPVNQLQTVSDTRGNRMVYALDAAGRRRLESVYDAGGSLRRHLARVFDALGRVQQLTGREIAP